MFGKYNQWSAGTFELFKIKLWHTSLLASTMTIWPFWPGISVLFLARSSSHYSLPYLSISWVVKNKSKNPWCWFFSLTLPRIMTRNFCLACLTRPSGSEKPASTASFLGWQDLHSIGHPWYLYMKFQAPTIYWDWKPIWPTPAVHTTIPHQIHPAKSHGIQQSLLGSLPNAVQGIGRLALHALADLHNPSTLATDVFQQQILP